MLAELYQYALSHELTAQPGFKPKRPKAYLMLTSSGEYVGIELRDKAAPPVMAPDIGAMANGTRYCNILIEKACIPLGIIIDPVKDKNIPTKREFYLSALESGTADEPYFGVLAGALQNEETVQNMRQALTDNKLKPADPIGFQVGGMALERSDRYLNWWNTFRAQFGDAPKGELPRCLITGQLAPALATVPKVSGLLHVGGHTSGDAFLCFDKDSFQSYGLKQSANAPVSEEAMTAVNASLTKLIAEAEVLGNAKLVHWYSGPVPSDEEPINLVLDGWDDANAEDDASAETDSAADFSDESGAMRRANKLIRSIHDGTRPENTGAKYYMLPLSGAGGRMMVRGWYEGSYDTLCRNVVQWFDDLSLVTSDGKGNTRPPKLKGLCTRLLRPGGDPKKVWDRLDQELPNLLGRILNAIISGSALPDEAASRALNWIRSTMLRGSDEKSTIERETLAFQLLKAWHRRKQQMKGEQPFMETTCNETCRSTAYCCGRLMATYSAIQKAAMPGVNVGVAEHYYAAASAAPGFVIGKLSQLAQHHLAKLDGGLAHYFEDRLAEIYCTIGEQKIPSSLNMEQQTEFALGYYQQRAKLASPKQTTI